MTARGLKGPADAAATPQPRASGWHPLDWACEYVGTAGQLAVGFSVVAVLEAPDSPGRHLRVLAKRHTPTRDALGYAAAQAAGALTAAAVFAAAWGAWAVHVNDARTVPARDLSPLATAGIEAALTCGLLLTVFLMLSSSRTARWAPAAVTGVLAMLIWAGAPHTGASMNPLRASSSGSVNAER